MVWDSRMVAGPIYVYWKHLHLKTYFLKSLHFGNFKNSVLKWVTRMYCFGLQECTVLGYKNGIKRVTKMEWIGLQDLAFR